MHLGSNPNPNPQNGIFLLCLAPATQKQVSGTCYTVILFLVIMTDTCDVILLLSMF